MTGLHIHTETAIHTKPGLTRGMSHCCGNAAQVKLIRIMHRGNKNTCRTQEKNEYQNKTEKKQ